MISARYLCCYRPSSHTQHQTSQVISCCCFSIAGCSKSTLRPSHLRDRQISNIKRFQPTSDVTGQTPVKSSVQRGIRSAILSSWKVDAETLEEIWSKKESIVHVKWSVTFISDPTRFTSLYSLQQRSSVYLHSARRTALLPTL